MNAPHVHLILNHLPVVVTPIGLVILLLGLLRRNAEFVKVGLGVVLAAALLTVPTYLTGEPAADVVGNLEGVPSELIERHEDVAGQAFAVVGLAGIAALAVLVLQWRRKAVPQALMLATVALALAASVWMGVTANLGGQIRHSEIRARETPGR